MIAGLFLATEVIMGIASAHAGRIWLKPIQVINGDNLAAGSERPEYPLGKKVEKGDNAPSARVLIINDVDLENVEDVLRVVVFANIPIRKYRLFFLDSPLRLVIDLPGKWKNPGKSYVMLKNDMIQRIRVGEQADRLRFVLDLKGREQPSPIVEELPRGLSLVLKKRSGFFR